MPTSCCSQWPCASRSVAGSGTPRTCCSWEGIVGLLVADIGFQVLQLQAVYEDGTVVDLGWILAAVLWGTAALHPTVTSLGAEVPGSPGSVPPRTVALLLGSLVGPVFVVAFELTGHNLDLLAVIPAALDLAAFRVIQEALNNVQKHAAGAATSVVVRRRPTEVVVLVENGSPAVPAELHASAGATNGTEGVRPGAGGPLAGNRPGPAGAWDSWA